MSLRLNSKSIRVYCNGKQHSLKLCMSQGLPCCSNGINISQILKGSVAATAASSCCDPEDASLYDWLNSCRYIHPLVKIKNSSAQIDTIILFRKRPQSTPEIMLCSISIRPQITEHFCCPQISVSEIHQTPVLSLCCVVLFWSINLWCLYVQDCENKFPPGRRQSNIYIDHKHLKTTWYKQPHTINFGSDCGDLFLTWTSVCLLQLFSCCSTNETKQPNQQGFTAQACLSQWFPVTCAQLWC